MCPEEAFDVLETHWKIWHFLGVHPSRSHPKLYAAYAAVVHALVTVFTPISMVIAIFQIQSTQTLMESLCVVATDSACSLKLGLVWLKRDKLLQLRSVSGKLDERIQLSDDLAYLANLRLKIRRILKGFITLYIATLVASEMNVCLADHRRLMYPAWFPVDWQKSTLNFAVVHLYQLVAIAAQILVNSFNDAYPPMCLAFLAGHLQLLADRITKLGADRGKAGSKHYEELVECIRAYQDANDFYNLIVDVISPGLFLQFLVTEFNIVTTIVVIIFFCNFLQAIYFILYFIIMFLQIYLACYYGTVVTEKYHQLSRSIYFCNWVDQDAAFRTVLKVFMQRTLQPVTPMAGKLKVISLESLMDVVRRSFSLYAVLTQIFN